MKKLSDPRNFTDREKALLQYWDERNVPSADAAFENRLLLAYMTAGGVSMQAGGIDDDATRMAMAGDAALEAVGGDAHERPSVRPPSTGSDRSPERRPAEMGLDALADRRLDPTHWVFSADPWEVKPSKIMRDGAAEPTAGEAPRRIADEHDRVVCLQMAAEADLDEDMPTGEGSSASQSRLVVNSPNGLRTRSVIAVVLASSALTALVAVEGTKLYQRNDEATDLPNLSTLKAIPWSASGDHVSALPVPGPAQGLLGNGEASVLGGSDELGAGAHLYVGFSPFGATKQNSFGVKAGFKGSSSDEKLVLLDVNGDGLLDKVEAYPLGASLIFNVANTFTHEDQYFSDVNGDGFPDFVEPGTILFNTHTAAGPGVTDTPVGMTLFYTDVLAKLWVSTDFGHAAPITAVPRFLGSAPRRRSCENPLGNVSGIVAGECDGLTTCTIFVHNSVFGASSFGCAEDFDVVWEKARAGGAGLQGPTAPGPSSSAGRRRAPRRRRSRGCASGQRSPRW